MGACSNRNIRTDILSNPWLEKSLVRLAATAIIQKDSPRKRNSDGCQPSVKFRERQEVVIRNIYFLIADSLQTIQPLADLRRFGNFLHVYMENFKKGPHSIGLLIFSF